ncbi:hypothetical protein ATANTOWER_030689 [Ataeniobius toweri]|uniref:NADH dehydrogenase subunit 6 n=1 Tax=Ataeniobius toweri TaxID=208326 RepID=A0ABU7B2Z9_9TELE|nr:hypothetical protein [Ataeniobius toweri]
MKPINTALFWIEYVIRHKGASHLKAQSYKMPWYIYHSVDVVLFLTGAVLLMLLATVMLISRWQEQNNKRAGETGMA